MTKEIKEEVSEMCNLGMAVELKGVEQGIEKGKEQAFIENIRTLMETMAWTAQQAMDALRVPKEEQAHYESKL